MALGVGTPEGPRVVYVVATTEQAEGSTWPADGAAGICPDCAGPVYYAGEPGSQGVWYHDSGSERCDD